MKTNKVSRPYTADELEAIKALHDDGCSAEEIGEITGRTRNAIYQCVYEIKKKEKLGGGGNSQEKPEPAPQVKVRDMTPREMIKKLYDMGYRIENNQLVCITRNVIKLNDILSG